MTPEPDTLRLVAGDALAGKRLDAALSSLLPGASLRLRRRLIETGRATLDGATARPGARVRVGQVLEVPEVPELRGEGADGGPQGAIAPGVTIIKRSADYAAMAKPCGVHSAALRGGGGPSVEAALPALFPGERPVLLNRLDRETSGFVLAAFGKGAAARFRELERAGAVEKEYLAVVRGRLAAGVVIAAAIDMADRARVRVLPEQNPDPARRTAVTPLGHDPATGSTLVRVVIHRGARHQIRAHLAHAGFPIMGDGLYGDGRQGQSPHGRLMLHHRAISFEGFAARLEPGADWPDELRPGAQAMPFSSGST
ncbi:MAG: pseudouridine synthase [Desulfovibrionaceae bacterium]